MISIHKTLNEKYMITPTAEVMLKNKRYFITFAVAFDIHLSLFICRFLLRGFLSHGLVIAARLRSSQASWSQPWAYFFTATEKISAKEIYK